METLLDLINPVYCVIRALGSDAKNAVGRLGAGKVTSITRITGITRITRIAGSSLSRIERELAIA
jgi:hypothetical protein